jgi:hypothetical protein
MQKKLWTVVYMDSNWQEKARVYVVAHCEEEVNSIIGNISEDQTCEIFETNMKEIPNA